MTPVVLKCPACTSTLKTRSEIIGKTVRCPKCKAEFVASLEDPSKEPLRVVVPDEVSTLNYWQARLQRTFVAFLQRVRRVFDGVGIGSNTLARLSCGLLASVLVFFGCLLLATLLSLGTEAGMVLATVAGAICPCTMRHPCGVA